MYNSTAYFYVIYPRYMEFFSNSISGIIDYEGLL